MNCREIWYNGFEVIFMYIRLSKSNSAKFTKVYLVEGYRDENGKAKQRIVKCYGNLEELQAKDPLILERLKEEAKQVPKNMFSVSINLNEKNDSIDFDKNYGYFFLESIFNKLKISDFFDEKLKKTKLKYDLNEALKLLVFSRIINPASKKSTVENQKHFFNPFDLTLDSIYDSLGKFNQIKEDLQSHLNQNVTENYGRDASLVFYDVTNYYFETEKEDNLKKTGVSKENRKSPIVQMGLLIDKNGLPISYKLFPGNTNDISTLISFVKEMREKYKLGRIILTADKGLNSGKNLAYLTSEKDGYIVSQKIRGSSEAFINEVLSEEGYEYNQTKTFKSKSFLRERSVKDEKENTVILKEKVVCFWSEDFDVREKHKREELEICINEFIENPSKYNSSNKVGIKKYLKLQNLDKETGEIEKIEPYVEFDKKKYDRDMRTDGYYCIITSEIELDNISIIEKYRGLWKIEESFRVIKSDLEGRPVYVWTENHIEGHFLICFLSLLIIRILELKTKHKFSVKKLQEALSGATCRKIDKGLYSLNKQDEVYQEIEKEFGTSLNYAYVKLEQLRNYRKAIIHNI